MRNSSSKTSNNTKAINLPAFKTEAEEAEWYHSPEGQRFMDHLAASATRPKRKHFDIKPTDPALLKALVERVKAKVGPQTIAISLRLPAEDLERAKKVAERAGVGYQAVLKEIIHESLSKMAS